MASTLEELIAKLNQNNNTYTPLTEDQMKEQAENRYASVYGQKRLTAQQQYDANDLALAQQLAGLQSTYDKQREQSLKNYDNAYSQADRHALSRGMQRSSYNNATLANISLEGQKAQQAINDTQAQQEGNIGEQRRQLSQQLAAQLAEYDTAQQQDILAYVDELEAREYERGLNNANTQNQLAMAIYEYQHQKEREDVEDAQWQAQFNAQYGGSSGGGGSRSGSPGNDNSDSDYQKLLDALNGSKTDNNLPSSSKSSADNIKKPITPYNFKDPRDIVPLATPKDRLATKKVSISNKKVTQATK